MAEQWLKGFTNFGNWSHTKWLQNEGTEPNVVIRPRLWDNPFILIQKDGWQYRSILLWSKLGIMTRESVCGMGLTTGWEISKPLTICVLANNPLNAIDPDGREIVWLNWGENSKIIRAYQNGHFNAIFTRFIKNQENVFITQHLVVIWVMFHLQEAQMVTIFTFEIRFFKWREVNCRPYLNCKGNNAQRVA